MNYTISLKELGIENDGVNLVDFNDNQLVSISTKIKDALCDKLRIHLDYSKFTLESVKVSIKYIKDAVIKVKANVDISEQDEDGCKIHYHFKISGKSYINIVSMHKRNKEGGFESALFFNLEVSQIFTRSISKSEHMNIYNAISDIGYDIDKIAKVVKVSTDNDTDPEIGYVNIKKQMECPECCDHVKPITKALPIKPLYVTE